MQGGSCKSLSVVEELIGKILWAFDVPIDDQNVSELVRKRIEDYVK